MAIRFLSVLGIPLSLLSIAAQTILKGSSPSLTYNGSWLLICFAFLVVANIFIIPDDCNHTTLLIYCFQAPILLISIFLGTIWDPDHQALTFLMFIMVMPVFVLDYPWRLLTIMTGWNILFLFLCHIIKDPSTWQGDLIHTLEFYLSSMAVTMVVLKLRFDVIHGNERINYHMEHDVLTQSRNRQSLEGHINLYEQRDLLVIMAELDQMASINDFYGKEAGDRLLINCASILQDLFGEDHVYRYEGNEFLVVAVEAEEEACLYKMEVCRDRLSAMPEKLHSKETCSFGYVTGNPRNSDTFRKMVQMAEINVHKAERLSHGNTLGSAYDEAGLRAGIVESNINTHLKEYETNRLTGLPGMEYFVSNCGALLDTMVYQERKPVIGYINILHLQDFNDAFGYVQGDELVKEVSHMLQEFFPARHLSYLSGGRFAVMCYLDEADPAIRRLNLALGEYKSDYKVEIKAGFAEYHKKDSVLSLIDKAKLSHDDIYSNKDRYIRFYDDTIDESRHFRAYITSHLDEAIESGHTKVYYQPIVRSLSGDICNMEALSRWQDPQYGFLMPFRFISVLEEERLIYKLNLSVVRQVVRDFRRLEEEGVPLVPVSVNLSRNDFYECDMVKEISEIMDQAGYPHSLLKIEITESAFVENTDFLGRELERFHAAGFEVWMDDFGSEYSTLNLLNELHFDLIKIDMQFMRDFTSAGKNTIIIDDIIGMSKRLGITTLVEGVEIKEHFEGLRQLGSEKLQGYYFARPMPFEDYLKGLRDESLPQPESGDKIDYYNLIGHINLHSPLSGNAFLGFSRTRSIPAAIVALREDSCILIRENEALSEKMLAAFPGQTGKAMALSEVDQCFLSAMERAADCEEWVFEHGTERGGQKLSIHARKIARDEKQETAVLLVILPG